MKSIEIITLQSAGNAIESAGDGIKMLMANINQSPDSVKVRLYRHSAFTTDLSFHIHHESNHGRDQESALGLRLASALGEFGRVHHTVWSEVEI